MATQKETGPAAQALAELAAARDEARVRMHLLSMEARERWRELESAIESWEARLGQGGERAGDAVLTGVRGLRQSVRQLFEHEARPEDAPASSIMSRHVASCLVHDSLNRAAQLLWETNCGALPVVGEDGTLAGMITDRDVCMAAYTQGRPLAEISVDSAMSRVVHACAPGDSIQRVLEIMKSRQLRRVPVTDERGAVIGIIALADVARWVEALGSGRTGAEAQLASTLAAISQPQPRPGA